MVWEKISRLLAKYNIKTIHQLVKKTNIMLRPEKENIWQNVPDIYHILCEWSKAYVGYIGHTNSQMQRTWTPRLTLSTREICSHIA
jgi:hypothetical protein